MGEAVPHDAPGHLPSCFEGIGARKPDGATAEVIVRYEPRAGAGRQDSTGVPACQLRARYPRPWTCESAFLAQKVTAGPSVTAGVCTTRDCAQLSQVKVSEAMAAVPNWVVMTGSVLEAS